MSDPRRRAVWSPQAHADLNAVWLYYAREAGPHTADNIVRDIFEAVRLLEAYPFAGRSRNEVRPGLRSTVTSQHVVFYRVKDDRAEIVRVLDQRRDIDTIFADDDSR